MIDDDTPLAARDIYKLGLQKKVNLLSGTKMTGVNQSESNLESDVAIAAEIDPRVTHIKFQPLTFDLNTGKRYATKKDLHQECGNSSYKARPYTPDFLLTLASGKEIYVEAKHTRWLKENDDYFQKIETVRTLQYSVILVTEALLSEGLVRNLRQIKPRVGKARCPSAASRVAEILASGPVAFKDLLNRADARQGDLFDAILAGDMICDLASKAFSPKSLMRAGNGVTHHLEILPL